MKRYIAITIIVFFICVLYFCNLTHTKDVSALLKSDNVALNIVKPVDTNTYSSINICKALQDTLLAMIDFDTMQHFTEEFFHADTLLYLNSAIYLVNIRYSTGCNGAGYCNIIYRISPAGATRLNDIKGYIDTVIANGNAPFIDVTLPNADIRLHYRLIYTRQGFKFKSFIERNSAIQNSLVKVAPEKSDFEGRGVNSEIAYPVK